MTFQNNIDFARSLDTQDPLHHFRERFFIPPVNGKQSIYLCGNSLGLQPKTARAAVEQEFLDWQNLGVEGHFQATNPWLHYHEYLAEKEARVVGAQPQEVVVMNNLTTNLHLMLVSFYQPTAKRFKIITEAGAFPSDQYALETQVKFHGFNPDEAIIELTPRPGEFTLRTEDILATISEHAAELALVMMGGINYYTGQVFDMAAITKVGHAAGAYIGFDLAHAAGNIMLELHNWDVDFAVWCTYKYMNSGPGNASGCFVHEKHHNDADLPRFAGWWGHNKERRFKMEPTFDPVHGAGGWQISNLPVLSLAPYLASVEMFAEVGMDALIAKRDHITSYLEFILHEIDKEVKGNFEVITPLNPLERASQLSVFLHGEGRSLFDYLMKNGVITDWREPNVIRLAPVPLYCSYEDMYDFGQILKQGILGK